MQIVHVWIYFVFISLLATKRRLWNRFIIMQSVCHIRELLFSFARTHTYSTPFGRYYHVSLNFPTVKVKVTETCFEACLLACLCVCTYYVYMHASGRMSARQRIHNHSIELNLILSVQKPMRNKWENNKETEICMNPCVETIAAHEKLHLIQSL